jgi:hypothetical protein
VGCWVGGSKNSFLIAYSNQKFEKMLIFYFSDVISRHFSKNRINCARKKLSKTGLFAAIL